MSDIEAAPAFEEIRFNVTGMTCATCSGAIEAGVGRHAGVSKVAVNLTTGVAVVTINPTVIPRAEEIAAVIKRMGFGATVRAEGEVEDVDALDKKHAQESLGYLIPFVVSLIFTVPLVTLAMGLMKIPSVHMLLMKPLWKDATSTGPDWAATTMFLLATPVQFGPYMGLSFYIHAVQEILRCRLGMNFLIAAGTSAAYFYSLFAMVFGVATGEKVGSSHFFETSAMLITFVLLGKFLESFAKARTSRALSKLMKMQPQVATVLLEDGLEMEVPIADVVVGDTLKVVPGSKVPCDGVVLSGTASIDKVMISGEPIPVVVVVEDAVIGGTICVDGLLTIRVTKSAADSTLSQVRSYSFFPSFLPNGQAARRCDRPPARRAPTRARPCRIQLPLPHRDPPLPPPPPRAQIIALVEDAQLSKAPIQSVADCISSVFAPIVALFSLVTFLIWLTLGLAGAVPVEWMPHNGGATLFALLFGISVMVIACPCALGLATPTAVMVGTGVGARYGVLIKVRCSFLLFAFLVLLFAHLFFLLSPP
jgi:Cu+-exporting ATPase